MHGLGLAQGGQGRLEAVGAQLDDGDVFPDGGFHGEIAGQELEAFLGVAQKAQFHLVPGQVFQVAQAPLVGAGLLAQGQHGFPAGLVALELDG